MQEAANEALAFNQRILQEVLDGHCQDESRRCYCCRPDIEAMKKAAESVYDVLLLDIPKGKALFDEIQAAKKK